MEENSMNNYNKILNKFILLKEDKSGWDNWTLEEKKALLEIYLIISKKEKFIFKLIWDNHGCDSWEDIFRDYNKNYLIEKANGVEVAIETLNVNINNKVHENKNV